MEGTGKKTVNVSDLLKVIQFPDDYDPTYVLAVSGPQYRQTAIREGGSHKEAEIAATIEIQRAWRGYHARRRLKDLFQRLMKPSQTKTWNYEEGATCIQKAWKRYRNRKTFKHYKKLLNFHKKGDPSSMLRYINPLESQLVDKASGCFVRFRLGGDVFPPTIYYKIFTKQTVVDVCTFSPRDYTSMCEKKPLASELHNRLEPPPATCKPWYQRWENNGWRPITYSGLCSEIDRPPVVTPFHHFKIQRQEDIIKKRKHKRRQWFMKLYTGMEITKQRRDKLTQNGHNEDEEREDEELEITKEKEDEKEEETLEELLQWTNSLDFDKYISDWQSIGTSTTNDPYTVQITVKQ